MHQDVDCFASIVPWLFHSSEKICYTVNVRYGRISLSLALEAKNEKSLRIFNDFSLLKMK